jgi:hypothetical protein
MGVVTTDQANNPDDIATQYKCTLRSRACADAANAVDAWDEKMPLWAFHMKNKENGEDPEAYRQRLKHDFRKLEAPGAYSYHGIEYLIWQIALLVGRPIVVLNLKPNSELCDHIRLYGCRDGQSHINMLHELEQILGIDSDRVPLVFVREGSTIASGHFTYLVGKHGVDIDTRERTQFLFRLGALQPVGRGALQTSGSEVQNLTQKRASAEQRVQVDSDIDEELVPPTLTTLSKPRASQPGATEPSRDAVEAQLHAKIAELTRALQKERTQLRRVDDALEAAAEASDVQMAIGCASVHRSKRSGPGRGLVMCALLCRDNESRTTSQRLHGIKRLADAAASNRSARKKSKKQVITPRPLQPSDLWGDAPDAATLGTWPTQVRSGASTMTHTVRRPSLFAC